MTPKVNPNKPPSPLFGIRPVSGNIELELNK